jgi:pyridoxamine 5'-phosphate oxidase
LRKGTEVGEILDEVWEHLLSGANAGRERSAYTLMQLATIGRGGLPKVRTIVVRRAIKERALLSFHTDVRSEKVSEIQNDAHVALLSSDVQAGIQIRLEGIARQAADNADRTAVWNSSRPGTLTVYRTPLVPGSPIAAPLEAQPSSSDTEPPLMAGFENFCLVDVEVKKIDYLDVSGKVHIRAHIFLESDLWHGRFVSP